MSLVLKNAQVYEFYQSHPQFDFEKMNVFLVEMLHNFQEHLNPSLDGNFAASIRQQMTTLQMELLKQQQTQQMDHFKHWNEARTQYIEELKRALETHQTSDRTSLIQSIETQFNHVLQHSETRLQTSLKEQMAKLDVLTKQQTEHERIQDQVGELLRKMDNSSSKGKVSETILGHVMHNLFPMAEIKAVGTTKETGDIMMSRNGFPTILLENKNYDRNVGQDEVTKFLRDVETQKCCGILLAQHYGIANRANFEIHIYQGQVCLYLHQVEYDPEKIKAAVNIIDHLSKFIESTSNPHDDISIDLECLDELNKEYQHFVQQKMAQVKCVKDYSQKMLASIDEMKFPKLENWVGKYFSQSLNSRENQCRFCGFEAKTNNGLLSHIRACKKRADNTEVLAPPKPPNKPILVVQPTNG